MFNLKNFFYLFLLTIFLIFVYNNLLFSEEITPYKFTNLERETAEYKYYKVPESSLFYVNRDKDNSKIVYYFSKPRKNTFPIVIFCDGSDTEERLSSVIHIHRYFLKEFLDLGVGLITIEKRGVFWDKINRSEFIENYTLSNRLQDHRIVINYLKKYPPNGWDGRLIIVGVSEGGPLVNVLTADYSDIVIASINWCGGNGFSWKDSLWDFYQALKLNLISSESKILTQEEYNLLFEEMLRNQTTNLKFLGMTYKYHADVHKNYPRLNLEKIKTPFLFVGGSEDPMINSFDKFVFDAQKASVPITYMRIDHMDHFIRKRPDIIFNSFEWLKNILIK